MHAPTCEEGRQMFHHPARFEAKQTNFYFQSSMIDDD